MKEKIKQLLKSRFGLAIYFLLISAALSLLIGGGLSLLTHKFIYTCQYMFFLFFAFPCVSALLLFFTRMEEGLTFGFGAGLYYGTLAVAAITEKLGWIMPDSDRFFLGFIIASFVCYIVYIKKFAE